MYDVGQTLLRRRDLNKIESVVSYSVNEEETDRFSLVALVPFKCKWRKCSALLRPSE